MAWRAKLCLPVCAAAMLQAGCSSTPAIPEKTLILREVTELLTRGEILASASYAGYGAPASPTYNILLEEGWQQADMVDGGVVRGRTQLRWTSASPGAVQQYACWSPVAIGLAVSPGNVVELEQRGGLATVVRIRFRSLGEGGCVYRTDAGEAFGTTPGEIRPASDKGAASLHCTGLAEQGWSPVRLSHGVEWQKPPPAGPAGRATRWPPSSFCGWRP